MYFFRGLYFLFLFLVQEKAKPKFRGLYYVHDVIVFTINYFIQKFK